MGAGIGVVALVAHDGCGPRTDLWCRIDGSAPVDVLDQRRPIAVIQRETFLVAADSGSNSLDDVHRDLIELVVTRVVHLDIKFATVLAFIKRETAADVTLAVGELDQITDARMDVVVFLEDSELEFLLGMEVSHRGLYEVDEPTHRSAHIRDASTGEQDRCPRRNGVNEARESGSTPRARPFQGHENPARRASSA